MNEIMGDLFTTFILNNFFLFCIALGIVFMVLRSYQTKRVVVLLPILVVSFAILLSIIYFIEQVSNQAGLVFIPTLCCALGFIIRPFILYFFMRMTITNKIVLRVARIMMGVNALVYVLSLFLFWPDLTHIIFYYQDGEAIRAPLFYTCHVILGIMMAYFIFHSISSLKGRHRADALACLVSAAFVLAAIILETALVAEYLLNTTIAIACLFYIIHLYQQALLHDALTGLFDRKAYYSDIAKIEAKITGYIIIDMNSLKYINDNYGHHAGDIALKTIADIIMESLDSKHMDAFRMGGDEFVIISTSARLNAIDNTITKIQEKMAKTDYFIALGYAKKENESITLHMMGKIAEEMMYQDKADYYKSHGKERRKR